MNRTAQTEFYSWLEIQYSATLEYFVLSPFSVGTHLYWSVSCTLVCVFIPIILMVSVIDPWATFNAFSAQYTMANSRSHSPSSFATAARNGVMADINNGLISSPFISVQIGSSETSTTCLQIPVSQANLWTLIYRLREVVRMHVRLLGCDNDTTLEYHIDKKSSTADVLKALPKTAMSAPDRKRNPAFVTCLPSRSSSLVQSPSNRTQNKPTKAGVAIMRRALLEEAALTIQKVARGRQGRRLYTILKAVHAEKMRKWVPALLIQRVFRGHLGRRRFEFERKVTDVLNQRAQAATRIQRCVRHFLFRRAVEFEGTVKKLMRQRDAAAILIQRVYKGFLARRVLKEELAGHVVRWMWIARQVDIVGSFTSPPWTVRIPLRYCRIRDEFVVSLSRFNLEPGRYHFKFVVDGSWLCDGRLPLEKDAHGNMNNVLTIEDVTPEVDSEPESCIPEPSISLPHSPPHDSSTQHGPDSSENIPQDVTPRTYARMRRSQTDSSSLDRPVSLGKRSNSTLQEGAFHAFNILTHTDLTPTHQTPPADLITLSGSCMIPHPEKAKRGGADAFVIEDLTGVVGVADGVGEWESYGLDPQMFARQLMSNCRLLNSEGTASAAQYGAKAISNFILQTTNGTVANGDGNGNLNGLETPKSRSRSFNVPTGNHAPTVSFLAEDKSIGADSLDAIKDTDRDPKRILLKSYQRVKAYGSSTALVCSVHGNKLSYANVGDSGFIVLRRHGRHLGVVYRSKEQQHAFNCPYQLSRLPPVDSYPSLLASGLNSLVGLLKRSELLPRDRPEDADCNSLLIQQGDLLILGTDGLFDNLYDHEILAIASGAVSPIDATSSSSPPTPPTDLAKALAEAASRRAVDSSARSPFSQQAIKNGYRYWGGKLDDITVVVSWIMPRANGPSTADSNSKI